MGVGGIGGALAQAATTRASKATLPRRAPLDLARTKPPWVIEHEAIVIDLGMIACVLGAPRVRHMRHALSLHRD
jgi:hypothetical protein